MAGEFINLKVKKVAIHKIFKREDKKGLIPPVYNDQCSGLDSEAKRALEARITKAFGNDSHSLKMKIENISERQDLTLFRQPVVLLLYYLVGKHRSELLEIWEQPKQQLELIYSDLGFSFDD